MRFLLVAKQKKVVEAFTGTLSCLIDRGHSVILAVQEHDQKRSERLESAVASDRFSVVPCPEVRSDEWTDVASLLRRLRDCVHYLQPPLRGAVKLRARVLSRLKQDLQFGGGLEVINDSLLTIPADHVARLDSILALAEQRLPPDPLFDAFLEEHRPDVLLLSPVVHFGPAQVDLIASARHLRIPVWMLLYSWDNLSTKGALHRRPDRMFVWNDLQRREAEALHGFPRDRVVIVGAPRFDEFFALKPAMTRERFLEPLGLDPAQLTLLYVCSSRFVSDSELAFVRRWIAHIRRASSERLRQCNIIVRPHPDIALLPPGTVLPRHQWPELPDFVTRAVRPFDDPRAIVLITPNDTPRGLFESIVHSDAVVGLNTTAEIEAGIVGRPVFTILADEQDADGQRTTVHFHYLRKEQGGIVQTAGSFDEHVRQLDETFREPRDSASIRAFVESFVRPHGFDKPVSPLFAELLETTAGLQAPQTGTERGDAEQETAGSPEMGNRQAERAVLPLGHESPALHVYAAQVANRRLCDGIVPIDNLVSEWIERYVAVGDVLYEVGAGVGECALVAAKRKGAVVVAFEPAYAAHKEFCDNILLNRCEALIVPVPLALAARDGLAEIRYLQGQPGEPGYLVRDDITWRVKHRGRTKPYLQPACLVRLDTFVEQQKAPAPHHLKISAGTGVEGVLAGAHQTLRAPTLKTIWLEAEAPHADAIASELTRVGWDIGARVARNAGVQFVFVRR